MTEEMTEENPNESTDENTVDLAADYIEELLDIADLDGDIELGEKNGRPYVAIVADDPKVLEPLIGENGEVLQALQKLTRLSVGEQTNTRSNLLLDINNWRDERTKHFEKIAEEAVEKLKTEEKIELDPMNSFERKLVHDKVKELGAFSHSKGISKDRHVVVLKEEPQKNDDEETNNEE